ncbi:MAG: SDR family NAD(P)-dependent oxidoreductase [Candidatus Heimdallarchaeota archaeon]|nr:SDR family NAD(P)-dependent oxidoreductase [Candidatus Heimdallarchaeota archaeon]
MNGKICMVTGANSGIGKATALGMAKMNAEVILVCRGKEKGEIAIEEIKKQSGNDSLDLLVADLALMTSVKKLVMNFKEQYDQLDVLVLNAGAYFTKRQVTKEGLERTAAVNYLSRFLLTNLLLDVLKKSAPARIISVVGEMIKEINFDDFMMERKYKGRYALARFTLANILFIQELAQKLEGTGVTANYMDPGAVRTNFFKKDKDVPWFLKFAFKLVKPFFKSPEKAAEAILYLAFSPSVQNISGKHFINEKEAPTPPEAQDISSRKRLWDLSAKLTKV